MRVIHAAAVLVLIPAVAAAQSRSVSSSGAIAAPMSAPIARGPAKGSALPAGRINAQDLARSGALVEKAGALGWQPPEHEIPRRPNPPDLAPPSAPAHSNEV